jgi:hypothetical protein
MYCSPVEILPDALVAPTAMVPKGITAGVARIAPNPPPVPLSAATAGVITVEEVTVKVPVAGPLAVG